VVAPVGVVVPIRSFSGAKSRLAGVLDPAAREALARDLATRLVGAAGAVPLLVVSSAPEVKAWAAELDLEVVHDPGSLDDAASYGRHLLASRGHGRVVVAHADLPLVRSLGSVLVDGTRPVAVVVPCHRDDGTPVLSLPSGPPFRFAYGPGSFRRHVDEARRRGLAVRVVRDPGLRHDIDEPEDLQLLG
jgi:2-phospho-L-lactate/phosphoenolpyruvate guanylyltransferase